MKNIHKILLLIGIASGTPTALFAAAAPPADQAKLLAAQKRDDAALNAQQKAGTELAQAQHASHSSICACQHILKEFLVHDDARGITHRFRALVPPAFAVGIDLLNIQVAKWQNIAIKALQANNKLYEMLSAATMKLEQNSASIPQELTEALNLINQCNFEIDQEEEAAQSDKEPLFLLFKNNPAEQHNNNALVPQNHNKQAPASALAIVNQAIDALNAQNPATRQELVQATVNNKKNFVLGMLGGAALTGAAVYVAHNSKRIGKFLSSFHK